MEVAGHLQELGDLVRLVDVAGPAAAHVQLLQRHNVGVQAGQHVGHAAHVEALVVPDAAMDVVGDDPGHEGDELWRVPGAKERRLGGWRRSCFNAWVTKA